MASTLIAAPLPRVIPVVDPPFIASIESINKAKAVASIVVSLTATVVSPVTLLNSLLAIEVPNVSRSLKLLSAKAVTLVKLTATEVAAFIVFKSAAVVDNASTEGIIIEYAFNPVKVTSSATLSVVIIDPETIPLVNRSSEFASSTVKSLVILISLSSSPLTLEEL